jgi:tetratricopeptide (TPR) repeat protein
VAALVQPPKTAAAPASFEEWSRRADAARSAGNLTDAAAAYERAVRLKPDWIEGYWYLGTTYYELDEPAKARDAFRRVLAAQPGNAGAWAFTGLCEFQLKSYDAALADLMKARGMNISANKDLAPVVRYHAGILLTRFQQFELAQKILTEFSILGNDNPKVIEALGMATLRIPMLPDELPAERREQVLLAGQGTYYLYAHAVAAAHKSFEELVRRYPDTPSVHYAYGVLLLNEDPDRGIEEFKKELALQPGSVASMLQIAFEYIKRSDWQNARTWAAQAAEAAPDNFAARQAYGQALTELGELDEAIRQLEAGIKLAADSPNLHYTLARAYQKAGRTADAERERLEFARLDREVRAQQHGSQAVGGEAAPKR